MASPPRRSQGRASNLGRGEDRARVGSLAERPARSRSAGREGAGIAVVVPTVERGAWVGVGAEPAGHGGWRPRAGRGCAVPHAAQATIQRTRRGAAPRGRLVVPRWLALGRVGGRVVVPRWPELARGWQFGPRFFSEASLVRGPICRGER